MGADGMPDPRYHCVSVEQTGFAPVALDVVLKQMSSREAVRESMLDLPGMTAA